MTPRINPLDYFRTASKDGPRQALLRGKRPAPPTCRGPAGHRQGPVGLGTTHHFQFFVTFRRCEPVVYEYKGERDYRGNFNFSTRLSWPQKETRAGKIKGSRNYYRIGDVIFLKSINQKQIPKVFRTLARNFPSFFLVVIRTSVLTKGLWAVFTRASMQGKLGPREIQPGLGLASPRRPMAQNWRLSRSVCLRMTRGEIP